MGNKGTTLVCHLLMEEEVLAGATGKFIALLTQIGLAAKIISRELNQAGLVNQLGYTGEVNIQGEKVKKLDQWANEVFVEILYVPTGVLSCRECPVVATWVVEGICEIIP